VNSNFDEVGDFHEKFGLENHTHHPELAPHQISQDAQEFRLKFMQEELNELEIAYSNSDLPKIFDALLDLVYVAMGTAQMHHFPWQAGWDEVQRANMTKKRAMTTDDSTRGSLLDVYKPQGWKPPDIEGVLERA